MTETSSSAATAASARSRVTHVASLPRSAVPVGEVATEVAALRSAIVPILQVQDRRKVAWDPAHAPNARGLVGDAVGH